MKISARSTLCVIALFLAATGVEFAQTDKPSISITIKGPESVKVGAPVVVEITVINTSNRTILYGELNAGDGERNFAFHVKDSDGKPAPETRYEKALNREDLGPGPQLVISGHLAEFGLKPGQTINEHADLSELFDLTPGNYTVQVSRTEGAYTVVVPNPSPDRQRAQQSKAVAESNTITITIVS